MNISKGVVSVSKILVLDSPSVSGSVPESISLTSCTLKWRYRRLWVSPAQSAQSISLPALSNKKWLEECLNRSNVHAVLLSPNLGEAMLLAWANICEQTKKPVFLCLPSLRLLHKQKCWSWRVKRFLDRLVAATLILILSPVLLIFAALIWLSSPGPIFYTQWRVGQRGQLFRIIKFRSMTDGAEKLHHQVMVDQNGLHKCKSDPRVTRVGYWMRKYSLDELPQLFNVLRGEMSFVGPRPWALYDAIRIPYSQQARLNALPGITGVWQIKGRSHCLDLGVATQLDLEYLRHWSAWEDLKILLLTIPRVISGFGAY